MDKVEVWYLITNCGDGSAYPRWFLSKDDSEEADAKETEPFAETCNGMVETYVGSNIHKLATENSLALAEGRK